MKPYDHQLASVKFMLKHKRGYIFNSIGTGKTATALWFCDILLHHGHIKKVLIISPLSTLQTVWVQGVKDVCPNLKTVIVHGPRSDREEALKSDAQIFITNTDCPRTYEQEILRMRPDVIIIDEVTSYSNPKSARSKCLQRICKATKSVFGMSGSPVAGGLMNSFGIAKIVNPTKLPTPYVTRFREMIMMQINMYVYAPKEGAEKIVFDTLQPAIRFTKEECLDLPDIVYETRAVKLPDETMTLFKTMLEHQIAEYRGGLITASTAGVKAIRLLQILTGSTKTEEGNIVRTDIKPKLDELKNIYHEAGNKLVVFTQSVESVKIVQEYFTDKGILCRNIYGDVPLNKRSTIIEEFQTKEEGVLVAQYRTMSHGITLTKASTLVFFGVISGNEAKVQCEGRIRRLGQNKRQTIIYLISTKFEQALFKRMDATNFTAETILDMYKNPKGLEGSL